MNYTINYQYVDEHGGQPSDDWNVVRIRLDELASALLPNVGDYVVIDNPNDTSLNAGFSGKVRSRLFHYLGDRTGDACIINIVVQHTGDDVEMLIRS